MCLIDINLLCLRQKTFASESKGIRSDTNRFYPSACLCTATARILFLSMVIGCKLAIKSSHFPYLKPFFYGFTSFTVDHMIASLSRTNINHIDRPTNISMHCRSQTGCVCSRPLRNFSCVLPFVSFVLQYSGFHESNTAFHIHLQTTQ
jgi:hypothetical protein